MRLRQLLPALTLLAAPAFAQDVHYGVSLGITLPKGDAGDFVDSSKGFLLGANLGIEYRGGHAIRPRLEFARSSHDWGSGFESKVTTVSFGMDYNYFVSGKAAEGFYVMAGLGFASTKIEVNLAGVGSADDSKGAMLMAGGLGYQFTPLVGTEVRYTKAKPQFNGETFDNSALNVAVTFRF